MTRTRSPRHSMAPLPRRVSIGRGHARRRNAPDNRLVDQSLLRDVSSGYRIRPIGFAALRALPAEAVNPPATNPQRRNPHSV